MLTKIGGRNQRFDILNKKWRVLWWFRFVYLLTRWRRRCHEKFQCIVKNQITTQNIYNVYLPTITPNVNCKCISLFSERISKPKTLWFWGNSQFLIHQLANGLRVRSLCILYPCLCTMQTELNFQMSLSKWEEKKWWLVWKKAAYTFISFIINVIKACMDECHHDQIYSFHVFWCFDHWLKSDFANLQTKHARSLIVQRSRVAHTDTLVHLLMI